MTIEVRIEKDSIGPNGVRLTTFVLKYPRFIHSEVMTHRCFSRNASSSRAIPFAKQMQMIIEECAQPLEFRKNQKGMQAGEAIPEQQHAESIWHDAACDAIRWAEKLAALGVHKQYVNRLVEPFAHITVVLSATEFANFFALRHHSMAQPEIAELARKMWDLYSTNTPEVLKESQWHLPFISKEEMNETYSWDELIKMSVARCARVSYLTHEGKNPSYDEDIKLYDRLLGEQPIHASPAEHQAQAIEKIDAINSITGKLEWWSGNFRAWRQFRQTISNQNILHFDGPLCSKK